MTTRPVGRVLLEELPDLLHQPATELFRHHGEVQRRGRILGESEEAVLDALEAVLQAEVEDFARAGGEDPERYSLGHPEAQLQCQPGLADLWRARQQVEPLGQQAIHHK